MSPVRESLGRVWSNQRQVVSIGLALLVICASGWVGFRARQATSRLDASRAGWKARASQLSAIQRQFQYPTSTESAALITESAAVESLGVSPNKTVDLLESLGRLAESSGMHRVRVNTTDSDSLFALPRSMQANPVHPASYGLTLDFNGSFAGLVRFVESLPPYVSASRIGAARRDQSTEYHVVLSVYELDASKAD
jgi:hypothetical protein